MAQNPHPFIVVNYLASDEQRIEHHLNANWKLDYEPVAFIPSKGDSNMWLTIIYRHRNAYVAARAMTAKETERLRLLSQDAQRNADPSSPPKEPA